MKKYLVVILFVLISLFIIVYFCLIRERNNVDIWICDRGEWVKRGRSSVKQPNWDCSLTSSYVNSTKADIVVLNPAVNSIIQSPLKINGQAVGHWFFEASFPIELLDDKMNIITSTYATALSDWMTTNLVDFTATMTYKVSTSTKGWLLFKNDNPSGLPDRDKSIKVPVNIR